MRGNIMRGREKEVAGDEGKIGYWMKTGRHEIMRRGEDARMRIKWNERTMGRVDERKKGCGHKEKNGIKGRGNEVPASPLPLITSSPCFLTHSFHFSLASERKKG